MAVIIDMDQCIGCNLCVPVCPNRAIAEVEDDSGAPIWLVKDSLCSECKSDPEDFYADHQCISVCPVDCITIRTDLDEPADLLKQRGKELADHRESIGLPRNFAYAENSDMEPMPGEFGPEPETHA